MISTPSAADAEPVAEALVTAVTDADIPSATPEQPVTVSAGFSPNHTSDFYPGGLVDARSVAG